VDIAECEEQDEGQRSNRAQAGARRNSSGSLAMSWPSWSRTMQQASVSSTGPGRREAAWLRHGGIKFSTARRLAGRHAVDAGGVSISPGRFVNSTPLTWGISTVTRRCDMSRGVRIFRVGRRGARLIERQPAVRSPDPDHAVQGCRPAPMFTPRPPSPQASVSLDGPSRREAAGHENSPGGM
jgi:hypothetical protein